MSIPPIGSEGFAIDLTKSGDGVRALFGELDEDFATFDDAMTWVGRALSSDYQLTITNIGGQAREWRLEPADAAQASRNVLAKGDVMLFRSFRSSSTTIRRNVFGPKPADSFSISPVLTDSKASA